ncbi:F0F1 ATP synthase subunit delta [Sansalvadorimonas verongulae]|uniref:F0F1 ATP synthase subunit delta n=1 Tax=Sansalvadorimonas verongulae TaxID=2172824 RepID=UPI0012BC3422|nr:F0F1 ATP synthase subunit delta [Sansalvadorimonas verongulae]
MDLITCARPYATAAFRFALEQQALESWSHSLNNCAVLVLDESVSQLLDQPSLTPQQKADAFLSLYDSCLENSPLEQGMQNFLRTLCENCKAVLLPQIAALFDTLKAEQEHSIEAEVASPFPLSREQQQILAEKLSKRLGAQVTLKNCIDRDMIGGLIIRAGDLVIDNCIRTRLAKLAHAMSS